MSTKHKHAVIATDVVIFTIEEGELKVLLIKMKKSPYQKHWAVPGGLVRGDEALDDSARRHLADKTGLRNLYLEQLAAFGEPKRDPFGRVVSVAYFALIPVGTRELKTTEEYGGVAWFPIKRLPPLAYDHKAIVGEALARLKAKLEYTNIVYGLMPSEFTLTELQRVYEIILDRSLDKRNFRKKILELKVIVSAKGKRAGAYRPAQLYRFKEHKPVFVEVL